MQTSQTLRTENASLCHVPTQFYITRLLLGAKQLVRRLLGEGWKVGDIH